MKLTTKKQLMARYTILFAIISLIVFYLFYKNGVTFIWGAKGQDGLSQHINALMYWGEYIRNFFFNIIHGHFRFPMWDMSIGFGADILGTLNYYAIGDPLNLIYVFSNKSNIELLYNFMLVFRLYLAGVAFIAFGHYLKKDGKSNTSSVVNANTPGAKKARLSYEVLGEAVDEISGKKKWLIRIHLDTGRHHQIRVQMAHAGMPLAGDRKYGAGTNVTIGAGSLALCAASLTFLHPVTGKVMKFVTKPEGAEFKGISIPQM